MVKAETIFKGCGIAFGIWGIYIGINMCREEKGQVPVWLPGIPIGMGVAFVIAFGLFTRVKPIN